MATIVTCYYLLPISKHNNPSQNRYLEWIQHMLKIDNPMVIFGDEQSFPLIKSFRQDKMDKTRFIQASFNEFYTARYYETFLKNYETDYEKRIGHNPLLYMIWNEKSNFLKKAIDLNPFDTNYYLWVDMGCFRYPTNDFLHYPNPARINEQDHSKVLLLQVEDFTSQELEAKDLAALPNYIFLNRISGTIFGGGKDILLEWHKTYYETLESFIGANRFIGKDQSIMNCVYLFHQDMCNLIQAPPICRDKWFFLQDYLQ
jgi:hypothetical protein